MTDLLSAMVQGSKAYADPMASAYAEGNRAYEVELRRPEGGMPTFDRATGAFTNPEDPLVYSGPARIHPGIGGAELDIGDERTPFTALTISINDFTIENAPDPTLAPEVDMTITVLDTPLSRKTHLAGRVFEVTGVDVGGHFGIGWILQTMGAAASRHG